MIGRVYQRAWSAARASSGAVLSLAAAKGVLVGALLEAAVASRSWVDAEALAAEAPGRRLSLGFANLAIVLTTTFAWSLLSTAHRSALIALVLRARVREPRRAVLRRLTALGWLLGSLDFGAMLVSTGVLAGYFHTDRVVGYIVAGYLLPWIVSRGFIGVAVALALVEPLPAATTLPRSVRAQTAHRLACIASRSVVPALAAVAAVVTPHLETFYLVPVFMVIEPLHVTTDSLLEAAWYEELFPPTDPQEVAALFS